MKLAHPINKQGQPIGELRKFTDEQWDRMVRTFGSRLRWLIPKQPIEKHERARRSGTGIAVKSKARRS